MQKLFRRTRKIIRGWKSFWYVTDGYIVYPMFIEEKSHIVCKIYMTRIVRAASPLGRGRKYKTKTLREPDCRRFVRRYRLTLCYSKSSQMLKVSIRLLIDYLKYWTIPLPTWLMT